MTESLCFFPLRFFHLFSSFFAIEFYDAFDRSESGGVLLLMFVPYATLCVGFSLLRLLWGIFCKKLGAGVCTENGCSWSRLALDVIPYSVVIFALMFYNLSYGKFLVLPLVSFLWDSCLEEYRDRKKRRFFFSLFAVVSYFLCGFWLFHGMDFSGNVVYLFSHFLEYLFPLLFFPFFRISFSKKKIGCRVFCCCFGLFSEIPIWQNLGTGSRVFCSAFAGNFYGNPFGLYETSKIAESSIHCQRLFLFWSIMFFKNTAFRYPYFIAF